MSPLKLFVKVLLLGIVLLYFVSEYLKEKAKGANDTEALRKASNTSFGFFRNIASIAILFGFTGNIESDQPEEADLSQSSTQVNIYEAQESSPIWDSILPWAILGFLTFL